MDAVSLMKQNQIDVLIPNRLLYFWPDVTSDTIYHNPFFMKVPSREIQYINPIDEVLKCLKDIRQDIMGLPHLYHGIVRRSFLNQIYDRVGTYFPGPSPDMANAIALSLIPNGKIAKFDYPLIIAGTGYKRIENNTKGDYQLLEKCLFLPQETINEWNENIPKIWTVRTIYAQNQSTTTK